jgi:plasmid maintenance system antidote protein VapI
MGTRVKDRDSEAIRQRVRAWLHATNRVPPTISALARELGVSRGYVQKLIRGVLPVTEPVAVQPEGSTSEREQIKAAMHKKAIAGDVKAAELWERMDAQDKGLGQVEAKTNNYEGKDRLVSALERLYEKRPATPAQPAAQPSGPLPANTCLAETSNTHQNNDVTKQQEEDGGRGNCARSANMTPGYQTPPVLRT